MVNRQIGYPDKCMHMLEDGTYCECNWYGDKVDKDKKCICSNPKKERVYRTSYPGFHKHKSSQADIQPVTSFGAAASHSQSHEQSHERTKRKKPSEVSSKEEEEDVKLLKVELKPLINNEDIRPLTEIIQFGRVPVNVVNISTSHLLFRGDCHPNPVLPKDKPNSTRFYGTLDSALNYAKSYIKIYQPRKELKLLDLTATEENAVIIYNLFIELFAPYESRSLSRPEQDILNELKILYILLQINFGLIVKMTRDRRDTFFCEINTMGIAPDMINRMVKYFVNGDIQEDPAKPEKQREREFIYSFIFDLLTACHGGGDPERIRKLIGSRTSIELLDEWILIKLKYYLRSKFDGVFFLDYYKNETASKDFLCKYVKEAYDKEHFKDEKCFKDKNPCVTTELCIFNPLGSLMMIELIGKDNGPPVKLEDVYGKFPKLGIPIPAHDSSSAPFSAYNPISLQPAHDSSSMSSSSNPFSVANPHIALLEPLGSIHNPLQSAHNPTSIVSSLTAQSVQPVVDPPLIATTLESQQSAHDLGFHIGVTPESSSRPRIRTKFGQGSSKNKTQADAHVETPKPDDDMKQLKYLKYKMKYLSLKKSLGL